MKMAGQYANAMTQIRQHEADLEDLTILLKTAARALRSMRSTRGSYPAEYVSSMPDVVHSFMEAYGWEDATITRTPPSKQEIDVMEKVLPWFFFVLQTRHRNMLFAHSLGMSLRKIGKQSGFSHERVRWFIDHAKHNMLRAVQKDLTECAIFDSLRERLSQCA